MTATTPAIHTPAAEPLPRARRWRLAPLVPLAALLVLVVAGPFLWPLDPAEQDLTARLQTPSLEHPLGTDQLGRDLLSRVLHGGRISLGVSFLAVLLSGAIGTLLGTLSGLTRGILDLVVMRVVDLLVSMPFLLLALAVAGLSGGGLKGIVLALGLFGWTNYARLSRAEAMRLRGTLMVEAAQAVGAGPTRILFRYLLPNLAGPILVLAVVRFSHAVLTIAGLSFLGVGVQPPTPEWGAMLADGVRFLERAPHVLLVPGTAITAACLVVSLSGDALRRYLDPRSRRAAS